jgi:UDP-N-acetylmuramoylalanine--D-glutamate ligase
LLSPGNLAIQIMGNAHVIGLGRSGIAAARLLKREGWEVILSDRNSSESLRQQQQELSKEGITVQLGSSLDLKASELPQLIVVSSLG